MGLLDNFNSADHLSWAKKLKLFSLRQLLTCKPFCLLICTTQCFLVRGSKQKYKCVKVDVHTCPDFDYQGYTVWVHVGPHAWCQLSHYLTSSIITVFALQIIAWFPTGSGLTFSNASYHLILITQLSIQFWNVWPKRSPFRDETYLINTKLWVPDVWFLFLLLHDILFCLLALCVDNISSDTIIWPVWIKAWVRPRGWQGQLKTCFIRAVKGHRSKTGEK